MTNYKVVASALSDKELDEGIQRTRKLLKNYQDLAADKNPKYPQYTDYADELEARLTAFLIEDWNRKHSNK